MQNDFDAIVVGSGAGGGTIAYALAKAGKQVLLVERGPKFSDRRLFQDERAMHFDKAAYDDRRFWVNGRETQLCISGVLGGGTSLYGGALLRPSRTDFHPGKHYGQWLTKDQWDWPITYDELAPYYDQAEQLFQVAGDCPKKMRCVETPTDGYPNPVPPLEPINQHLEQAITESGWSPFHLPFGIDFRTCLRCTTCPGYYCPNESRASTLKCVIEPAVRDYGLQLAILVEAEQLLTRHDGQVSGVRLRWRQTGQVQELNANVYILAAGAIATPVILMKSGLTGQSAQVGRNYMYHCGALAAGIFARSTEGVSKFIKQLGFTDLYFGNPDFPHKLGFAQTIPIPGPLTLQDNLPLPMPTPVMNGLLDHMLAISGTVEDLPQPDNRVELTRSGQIRLHHRFHEYDILRSKYYLQRLKQVLKQAGAFLILGGTGDKDDVHTSHQVGTTRFGHDPKTSVLDPHCRLHGHENVFIVDGGFMPTALGVGPALTIMANALRVAKTIEEIC